MSGRPPAPVTGASATGATSSGTTSSGRGWEQVTRHRLDDFTGGWFVGAFSPTLAALAAAEVAVQRFTAGQVEPEHHHLIATEITVLVSGRARMCGRELTAGDVLVLPPGTATAFEALEDCVTTVVKLPSVPGDKYPGTPAQPAGGCP